MLPHTATPDNPGPQQLLDGLQQYVRDAARQGLPAHEAERTIWRMVLAIGHAALGQFFAAQGSGDLGETLTLPDGREVKRLPQLHTRRYVSAFGEFALARAAYGSREGQAIAFVPLDARLQLPAGDYSYLLQDWDQALCVEESYGQASATVARMLGLRQPVDSLERMSGAMAEQVSDFRESRPKPDPAQEGEVLVTSADGKGIVMRRAAGAEAPRARRRKGDKANQKRMATVGAAYTVGRYVRTPEGVVAALFRDGPPPPARPQPRHKRVWASLPAVGALGEEQSGVAVVHEWLQMEVVERNRGWDKEMVHLADGQEALWEARQQWLPGRNLTEVLDLLHATSRLWQAAHLFHRESSPEAEAFARAQILRVLQGGVAGVVRGLRALGRRRGLTGAKKKSLGVICNYLWKNRGRMRYDEYLAKGYPIASGVIEGACRHLVKDRMERAGMHWTAAGAQAMLDVRSVFVDGCWEEYQAYRIRREAQHLYPYRHLVEGPEYVLAC